MAKQTIFISYRRQDTAAYAGRIYDRLSAKYGEENVFMDIDRIEPGQDFVDVINSSVAEAGVLLVLIGREWIKMTDKSGVPRLENPEDFVRLEILAGLEQKTVIIPVLLADFPRRFPRRDSLIRTRATGVAATGILRKDDLQRG